MEKTNPWRAAIIIWPIWTLIVISGEWLQAGGELTSLNELVSTQILLALVVAPLFLMVMVARLGWWQTVGFQCPRPLSELRLLWLPALFLIVFFSLVAVKGLPPAQMLGIIVVNTLLVGLSEELMFRGLLLHGAMARFAVGVAVLITAIIFGSIHALNGLLTGDFPSAFTQAVQAAMFGVWVAALRLRLGSLWPVILIHGLWDLGIFLISAGAEPVAAAEPSLLMYLIPVLIEAPLFLYGLWLLRGLEALSAKRHPE